MTDPEQVADAYLAYATSLWSQDHLAKLIRQRPAEAWEVITRLIVKSPEEAIGFVAAGPLEEFVIAHGEQYLEIISAHARTSPGMQQALGGLWQESQMSKRVWKQIQKLAGKL